jgi:hypothetical protein
MARAGHTQQVVDLVSRVIEPKGYRRKRKNWYGLGEGVIPILVLTNSDWGRRLFLGVGFWIHALVPQEPGLAIPDPLHPQGFQCPITLRTPSLDPSTHLEVERALDLEPEGLLSPQQATVLQMHLERTVLPFLMEGSSLAGLANLLKQGRLGNGMVHHRARTLLESYC